MKFKPNPNDVVIVIMGPTGSGKTNFINALAGNAENAGAAYLESATRNVTPYTIHHHGLRLVLVDTPGFDDMSRSDWEILQLISEWLAKNYPDGETLKLIGIIYLHRITDRRMSTSAPKNLRIFSRLCGNIPLRRARLVTTMWDIAKDRPGRAVAENREKELRDESWGPLVAEGAIVERFDNEHRSALRIVDDLIRMEIAKDGLLTPEELAEQQKHLSESEAGMVLYSRFQRLLKKQRKTLEQLADEAKLQNDPNLANNLEEEYDQMNAKLRTTFEEIKAMKIPFTRRVLLWLFGGISLHGVRFSIFPKPRSWNTLNCHSDAETQYDYPPDGMIFVVIGLTGSGKTHFIDALSGTSSDDTGTSSLTSGTRAVLQRTVKHDDGRTLVFLDTPGFNNIFLKDEQILSLLAEWLKTHYLWKTELSIIYLHRITDNRIIVPPPRYISMLRNQCSGVTVRQICLVTTMWDDVVRNKADAERREELLKEEFRKKNVRALFERFENEQYSDSAWNIMNKLVGGIRWLRQDTQGRERFFSEPETGNAPCTRFQELTSQRKEVVQQLVDRASTEQNMARLRELQEEHGSLDTQLRLTFEQMRKKKIPRPRRVTN